MGKISQYTRALKAKLSDLFVVASSDNGSLSTKAVTTEQIGDAIITEQTFSGLDGKTPASAISDNANSIGNLSNLTTTDKSSLVGAVNEVVSTKMNADKIKTYNWKSTNVAITTLYSGGSMYYCDITFPVGEATDCNEILALTMVDYGGLSNVLQFQIRGSRTFRIWSKTSMTLSTLTVKVLYFA